MTFVGRMEKKVNWMFHGCEKGGERRKLYRRDQYQSVWVCLNKVRAHNKERQRHQATNPTRSRKCTREWRRESAGDEIRNEKKIKRLEATLAFTTKSHLPTRWLFFNKTNFECMFKYSNIILFFNLEAWLKQWKIIISIS